MAYVLVRQAKKPGLGQWGPPCDPWWSEQNGTCTDAQGNFLIPTSQGIMTAQQFQRLPGAPPPPSPVGETPQPFDFKAWLKRYQTPIQIAAGVLLALALAKAVRR